MAGVRLSAPAPARVFVLALACATGAVIAGCGGEPSDGPAPGQPRPTAAGGYELDVIAEAEPDEGAPPLTVHFHGYVEEDEGGPWRFHWDFGDGASSEEQNPRHTYESVGDYTAVVTATDRQGNTGTD
jgi:uncharacterized membrane protein